jgi:hypothetical protein
MVGCELSINNIFQDTHVFVYDDIGEDQVAISRGRSSKRKGCCVLRPGPDDGVVG